MNEEANRKIAEWAGVHWHEFPSHAEVEGDPKCKQLGCRATRYDHTDNPAYDTNPSDCLSLIEAVRAKGLSWEIGTCKDGWEACIWPGNGTEFAARADTLPQAVSAAVLKLIDQTPGTTD